MKTQTLLCADPDADLFSIESLSSETVITHGHQRKKNLLFFFSCYKSYLIISLTEHKTFPVLLTRFLSLGLIKDSSVFSDEA